MQCHGVGAPVDGHEALGCEFRGVAGGLFGEEVVVGSMFAVLPVFDKSDVEPIELFGDFVEMAALCRVAVEIEFFVAVFDDETGPQGLVAVSQSSRGIMAGR